MINPDKFLENQSGFTLIEVLIYSVLLAVFLGAAFSFVASILGSTDTLLEKNEILANQEMVERKIAWVLSRSAGISTPLINSSSTSLSVLGSVAGVYPAIFSTSTNNIRLSLAGGVAVPITNNRVKVNKFLIERFSVNKASSSLRVSLDISSAIFNYLRVTTTIFYVIH